MPVESLSLQVLRFSSQNDSTLGLLLDITNKRKFLAFTIEDEYRTVKKYSETRIPAGTYPLVLRHEGGFHDRYKAKFPNIHKGMLWIKDVPGFEYILIHIGNTDDDTAGCLIIGNGSTENITNQGNVSSSTAAYKRIYPFIADKLLSGVEANITYIDFDMEDLNISNKKDTAKKDTAKKDADKKDLTLNSFLNIFKSLFKR